MIITTRFAKRFVARWGNAGSLTRGMVMLLLGAGLLSIGQVFGAPSFGTFIVPMWVMAIGIVFTVSVTANGALEKLNIRLVNPEKPAGRVVMPASPASCTVS